MACWKIALFAALVAFAVSASDVIDTKDSTFEEVIASHDFVLMEFYAPWCGHCKKLAPEWEKAATALKGAAVIAKLDATVESESANKYEVKGYPTIKVFRGGKLQGDYEGQRSSDAIINYVKSNSGPAVVVVDNAEHLEKLKEENAVVVVSFGNTHATLFEAIANRLRGKFRFATATPTGDETADTIVVYKSFDDKRELFDGEYSEEAVIEFINAAGMRLFDEIGPENYKMYVDRALPMGWFFVTPAASETESAKAIGEVVAKMTKGKMSVVWIDASKYGGMAQRLGLSGDKFPAFAIDKEGTHFAFSGEFTEDAVKAFVQDFLDAKLEATIRSEAEPEQHTVDGLTTVVGKTFESLVTNADQDVLIEFYAPWCGHCKSLAPTYAKVAKAAADKPVRVAQIDATANDFPQQSFPVQGFPTIFYVPKGGQPTNYDGERSFDGFAKFLKDKANIEIIEA